MSTKVTIPNAIMLAEVNNLLQEGHNVVIMTKGNSMLPFIRGEKDSVELRRNVSPAVGDIALAQIAPGHYVLHRIIVIEGDRVTLKGDGNLRGTENCTLADICGTVEKIVTPSGKEKSCTTPGFARRSRCWNALPYIIRRYTLGLLRRII